MTVTVPMEEGRKGRRERRSAHRLRSALYGSLAGVAVLTPVMAFATVPVPVPTFQHLVATRIVTPGVEPAVSWPAQGQAAYSIPALDVSGASPIPAPVPIGSITKMMTAHVVLRDLPLSSGIDGPTVTVTPADVAAFEDEVAQGQSNVAIAVGEVLTERQLLEGALIHSGNDYTDLLARLDAGSTDAFVAKLNAEAARLGLTQTTYADASGYSPKTVSTPAEQLKVAAQLMADPTTSEIVAKTSVELPVAGTVTTYTPFLGTYGVVGVKSGLTTVAGGCDVMAINTTVAGQRVQILTAVTGQQGADRLGTAGQVALDLAIQVERGIVPVIVAAPPAPVATLGWHSATTPLVTSTTVAVASWPGHLVTAVLQIVRPVWTPQAAGAIVGVLRVASGSLKVVTPLRTGSTLPGPTLLDRLF